MPKLQSVRIYALYLSSREVRIPRASIPQFNSRRNNFRQICRAKIGLLLNLVQYWFPSLMSFPGFLKEFVTPIVKVHKGGRHEKRFYTLQDYEAWKKTHHEGKGWDIKYYKGLGTSTAKEAKEYFRDIDLNEICFTNANQEDTDGALDLAFNKTRADDRKDWMNGADDGIFAFGGGALQCNLGAITSRIVLQLCLASSQGPNRAESQFSRVDSENLATKKRIAWTTTSRRSRSRTS